MRARARLIRLIGALAAAGLVTGPVAAQSPPVVLDETDDAAPATGSVIRRPSGSGPVVLLSPEAEARCDDEAVAPVATADLPPGLYGSTFQQAQAGQRINTAVIV